jgi:predicted transcriptional regulator
MDYEFRIQVAEKELAHLREMQRLMRSNLDAHDASFDAAIKRFERIEANLESVSAMQKTLSTAQLVTEQKMQGLIDLLVREHANGHKQP